MFKKTKQIVLVSIRNNTIYADVISDMGLRNRQFRMKIMSMILAQIEC